MKWRYYFIPTFFVLICAIFAIIVRFSYTNRSSEFQKYTFGLTSTFRDDKNISTYSSQNLLSHSQLVVQAKFNGERKLSYNGFYTDIIVTKVYKGDKNLVGQHLCILENVRIYTWTKYISTSPYVYLPLQAGSEYILLLNKVNFQPERKLNDFQKKQYYPSTQSSLSVFRISNVKQEKVLSSNTQPSLDDLNGFDIPATSEADLNLYYKVKNDIFKQLGVQ